MDIIRIEPGMLSGKVNIPSSKSFAHRAVIAAFLSGKKTAVKNLDICEDISATINCIKSLGASCEYRNPSKTLLIERSSGKKGGTAVLNCCESGSTLRFFIPIVLAMGICAEFIGCGRLMQRPLEPYFKIMQNQGISYIQNGNSLKVSGKLRSGKFFIDGKISSQFITGLLFALPLLDGNSEIIIVNSLESKAYIDITISVLKSFGISIKNKNYESFIVKGGQKFAQKDFTVESDYSQAAFFLTAGAIGCDIKCLGLNKNSLQGDSEIINIIERLGGKITRERGGAVSAKHTACLKAATIDVSEIPDLVPILAVLLCFCEGTSLIVNAARLRMKESDRLRAISSELSRMGANIKEGSDFLEITGTGVLHGETVSAWNDHRIAMALAIAACRCEGEVIITGAKNAVKKSYPNFFDDYAALGGTVT